MIFSRLTLAASVAALFGAATADLQVIVPGGPSLWWIAKSQNNIVWTCQGSPYQNFTVLIANQNPQVLTAPIAIIAVEDNFDCSKTITPDQANQPVGTGYIVQLANTLNSTDVYAQSEPFEIKAFGAAYPASSATPTATGTSASSAAGGASSASSTPSHGAAASNSKLSTAGFGLAAIGAFFGFMV